MVSCAKQSKNLERFLLSTQGVHFPALASISSRNLNNKDRTFFFSATSAGSAMGDLFTGIVGSYANEAYGWPYVFYFIGKNIFKLALSLPEERSFLEPLLVPCVFLHLSFF